MGNFSLHPETIIFSKVHDKENHKFTTNQKIYLNAELIVLE